MPLKSRLLPPLIFLTQDGVGIRHSVQAARLCSAGARWIQLRMKEGRQAEWLGEARAAAQVCRSHGSILIINDSVEIALACGADGAHLGALDGEWEEARGRLGPHRILGGTVNNPGAAEGAAASGCLDYVGVGPFRFTATKRNLAPVLGAEGIREVIARLRGLPAWAIGGVTVSDVPVLRQTGVSGIAVSSALYGTGRIEDNARAFEAAWEAAILPSPAHTS